ncbi:MAG: hypothetical protein H6835_14400 [Planctomycetes bacterium]|nr:hypothetical protein [Planctomycetota bacterium]
MWCDAFDASSGERCRIEVCNDAGRWPQTLGSSAHDDLCVPLAAMPAQAVRLLPSGPHLQVTALVANLVRVHQELLEAGASRRTDGAFEVGTISVKIHSSTPTDDSD